VKFAELLEEILELVQEDAEALDCVGEIASCRTILQRGTSAERQIAVYEAALASGMDAHSALQIVVDSLIADTVQGTAAQHNIRLALTSSAMSMNAI
jgi:carboxylate-amine ligase